MKSHENHDLGVHTQWIEILFDGAILFLFLQITIFLKVEENLLKFKYCEKATKFEKNLPIVGRYSNLGDFFQIFLAFSEYLNFKNKDVHQH